VVSAGATSLVDQGGTGRERSEPMTQLPKLRAPIYGKPSLKASPAFASPVDTPAAQAAAKAAATAPVLETEAANLRGELRPDERYPSRD
jgi:hypothetical protein